MIETSFMGSSIKHDQSSFLIIYYTRWFLVEVCQFHSWKYVPILSDLLNVIKSLLASYEFQMLQIRLVTNKNLHKAIITY